MNFKELVQYAIDVLFLQGNCSSSNFYDVFFCIASWLFVITVILLLYALTSLALKPVITKIKTCKITEKEVTATVTKKECSRARSVPVTINGQLQLKVIPSEHKIFLVSGCYTDVIDDENLFNTVNIGDKVKVILKEKLSKNGKLIAYDFELPST